MTGWDRRPTYLTMNIQFPDHCQGVADYFQQPDPLVEMNHRASRFLFEIDDLVEQVHISPHLG